MTAGRPRELKGGGGHFTVYVNPSLVEEFEKTLPRRKSVSEALREYMESAILEKNREALIDLSPIRQAFDPSNTITTTVVNESLDRFMQHIGTIEDIQEAAVIEGKTMQMHTFARQRYLFLKRR